MEERRAEGEGSTPKRLRLGGPSEAVGLLQCSQAEENAPENAPIPHMRTGALVKTEESQVKEERRVKVAAEAGSSSSDAPPIQTAPHKLEDDVCPEVEPPPRPPLVPRSTHVFVPKCHHRHALKRLTKAPDNEPLECDGACGNIIPPDAPRWSCYPCDFDMCELCLLSVSGGAAYLQLLADEEKRGAEARDEAAKAVAAATERAKAAESKLGVAEARLKAAGGKQTSAAETAHKRAAIEAKLADAEDRAAAAGLEVVRLEREVIERRQRSKANLEKMYTAQKERDEARALVGADEDKHGAKLQEARAEAEEARRQLAACRQQLACAFGEPEALSSLSLEEVDQLESLCFEGFGRVRARRVACAAEEELERSRRADCPV